MGAQELDELGTDVEVVGGDEPLLPLLDPSPEPLLGGLRLASATTYSIILDLLKFSKCGETVDASDRDDRLTAWCRCCTLWLWVMMRGHRQAYSADRCIRGIRRR